MPGPLRVIARDGVHEIEIQRSRFRCALARVSDDEQAAAFIAGVRREHRDATHNCSAFRVGPDGGSQRSSDDGEPGGTAGVPMLEVLLRRELTDVAAVVTRWFGGIKLGAGGLVRAYGRSVSEAVDALGTLRRVRHTEMLLAVEHAEAGRVQNALLTASCRVVDVEYGADAVLTVQVPSDEVAPFRAWLAELTAGTVEALITSEVDVDVPG